MLVTNNSIGVYIHWPFCESKCPYCDFNSHVRDKIEQDEWLSAYLLELQHYSDFLKNKKLESIFFGGGTPSLAEPKIMDNLINYLVKHVQTVSSDLEITVEANPSSIEIAKFKQLKDCGVNRISLGVQSLREKSLIFLERKHNANSAKKAIEYAASIFANYSFDLMYALPTSTLKEWEQELYEALQYKAPHMSLYQLTIEKGTRFFSDHKNKKFQLPPEEEAVELYTVTQDIMKEAGMPAYEVSNHAKPSYECKHNMIYWEYVNYLGIGPGAHSRYSDNDTRIANINLYSPEAWIAQINNIGHGLQSQTTIPKEQEFEERLLMGLRLYQGICMDKLPTHQSFYNKLKELLQNGFMEIVGNRLIARPKGMLVLNHLIYKLTIV